MSEKNSASRSDWLAATGLAVGLTVVFWWKLYAGGAIIGGDLFTYFMPQKQFYAEHLASGELPLWHNRTGFGYPLLAESQTGVLYPPHLILYRLLDVTTAYNVNQLLHYVLTFVLAWRYVREVGVRQSGSLFAALVFTYGWFPSRLCLEWAIIGGPYLPGLLLLTERFLRTAHWRYPIFTCIAAGFQLLAGHFNLAFITQLVLISYVPLRLWFAQDALADTVEGHRGRSWVIALGFLAGGFALAAVQLLPTWELKQASQRASAGSGPEEEVKRDFDPAYGHIPPLYLSQVFASWWYWYDSDGEEIDLDQAIQQLPLTFKAGTNKAEAHLNFGLIALGLLLAGVFSPRLREVLFSRFNLVWLLLAVAAVIYATAWLLPVAKHLPGFSFFRGPGRYGIVTTLGVALVAGSIWSQLTSRMNRGKVVVLSAIVLSLTAAEFWRISRDVTYATIVDESPLVGLSQSDLSNRFRNEPQPVRLLTPLPNVANPLGVSSVPEYLGLGPSEYYDPELKPPGRASIDGDFLDWARRSGVDFVLWEGPLGDDSFAREAGLEFVTRPHDKYLNAAWGRREPFYFYKLHGTRGRVVFDKPTDGQSISVTGYRANEVGVDVETPVASRLVLTDLMYPGWEVFIDDQPAESIRYENMFRAVDVPAGRHSVRWEFRSGSFRTGLWISAVTSLILAVIGHVRFWHFRPMSADGTVSERS